ncbi:GTP-binding protein [Natrarchaeobius sp. A-rgal3]|uniref:CobW family GTP-binding protein n=1 Tax=Natrarchaeobius versutus TaxID=1679078 RepID=UPI003510614B
MAIPVTILCGELGAGKTTLLSGLLESSDREIGLVVNDVGAVNVDADLVEARTDLSTGEEVLALENGCICCSLSGDLSRAVIRLQREREFDHLVVEASGVGEPEPIARQFVRGPAAGVYDLESVVTVVDARRFHDRFVAPETDEVPAIEGPDETGTRPLADLALEQVEFCDLLVVNKCDLVTETERERVVAVLETLQPNAAVVTTEYGRVDADDLLGIERFDLETAAESAGWKRVLEDETAAHDHDEHSADHDHDHDDHGEGHDHADHHNHGHTHDEPAGHDHDHQHDDHHHGSGEAHDHHDHAHPPEEYGIDVDGYRRRRPFHPERFAALLADLPDGLVRAKGLCWIAGRERQAITMSFAGSETSLEVTGRWIASLSEQRQERYRSGETDLEWDEQWGDRETRLALIGRDLEMDALIERLDDCLLTDDEMDDDWTAFENDAPTAMDETVTLPVD